jgi:hypothetical protein
MRNFKTKLSFLKCAILLFTFLGFYSKMNAQQTFNQSVMQSSIGGYFERVYDKEGNAYSLNSLRLPDSNGNTSGMTGSKPSVASSCSSGHFILWFEQGWNTGLTATQTLEAENTFCLVFTQISNFLTRPAIAPDKINIWIRDISQFPNINASTLGFASPFSYYPGNLPAYSGISDNLIWLTYNGGFDGYSNIASPLVSNVATYTTSAGYFHGQMAYNFSGSTSWHTNSYTQPATANERDLYSVVLHEVIHELGFYSLIDQNGNSLFGTSEQYYNRYDMHLKNIASGKYLISQTASACGNMYQYEFNPSLSKLILANPLGCTNGGGQANQSKSPISIDYEIPSSLITFTQNIPVYNPACFEKGASFAHLEDEVVIPIANGTGNISNGGTDADNIFTMSNKYMNIITPLTNLTQKRTLSEYERAILSDIGYQVTPNYGATTTFNSKVYSLSVTNKPNIVGYCDGISNVPFLSYTYSTTANGPLITINHSALLLNDVGATSIECVELMTPQYGSITTGSNTFTFSPGANGGLALVRYVPIKMQGATKYFGNITYVYIYVQGNCAYEPCLLNANPGFESTSTTCGPHGSSNQTFANCWELYTGSPDYFSSLASCTATFSYPGNPINYNYKLPANNTTLFLPLGFNVWNATSPPTNGNNNIIGMYGGIETDVSGSISNYSSEGYQTRLKTNLVTGQYYTLELKMAGVDNTNVVGSLTSNINLAIYGTNGALPFVLQPGSQFVTNAPNIHSIHSSLDNICKPNDNQWYTYTTTFQYTGNAIINNLLIGNNAEHLNLCGNLPSNATLGNYLVIDDIKLSESSGLTFSLPTTNCGNVLSNLV